MFLAISITLWYNAIITRILSNMHKITEQLLALAVPINSIKPDPANPRENHDVEGIAKSFNDYGQCEAIVVNKTTKMIEAGHGRLYAALKLGWSEIAVNFVDHDDQQAIGYNIAANRLSDLSRFNDEALLTLLQSLDNPLDVPGIDDAFMAELLENVGGENSGGVDIDEFFESEPAPPKEPKIIKLTCPHCGKDFEQE